MARPPMPEKLLRFGIFAGIALLLLTPFVVTPMTIFPFVVGKAVWSRSIIEVVFALWAVLALANPAYRPLRSWLLILLAAGLAVSLLAAGFGVSIQRSLWSSYERMQGMVDFAHWLALAVVLSSVFRSSAAWRAFLAASVGAGVMMACLVIARRYQLDVPFYGKFPEQHLPRVHGPFGNPIFLSVYMLVNLMTALGLGMRSWLSSAVSAKPCPRSGARWARAVFWAAVVALHLWGLVLAGSVGGIVGLLAGIGFVAVFYAFLARGRGRWAAVAVVIFLGASAAGVGARFIAPDRLATPLFDNPVVQRIASVHVQRPAVQGRLAAWETGLKGFAERPVLGWGPENFVVVFGRFASGYGAVAEPHDQAHGKLIEVAATTGLAGLAAYLALWILTFLVVWRAARRMEPGGRAVAVFVGAALAGILVQSQFLFDTTVTSLQTIVLLGFVVSLEAMAFSDSRLPRLPARLSGGCAGLLRRKAPRVALGTVAVAVAVVGFTVHQGIYAAANMKHLPVRSWSWGVMADGIESFRPLANTYRWWLFNMVAHEWSKVRAEDRQRSLHLIEWVSREAEAAARTEPEGWQIQQSIARMFRAVAATDPGYGASAQRYLARAQALAPDRPVFPDALHPPDSLTVHRLSDGRYELRWRWPEGAGYVAVAESTRRGPWRHIFHAYDTTRTSFVLPEGRMPGVGRYRIKICHYPKHCSASTEWPAIPKPADEPSRAGKGGPDAAGGRTR